MPRPASREIWRARWRQTGRWRYALAAALLAGVALFLLWAGGGLTPRDRTWERIQEEGVMRIGMDASFPPFQHLDPDTGEPAGLDVDLAHALGERMGGIQPQFINVGFDGLYDSLIAGRFDAIISAMPVDYTWTEDVRYSQPYFEAGLVMVMRDEDVTGVSRPQDLAGRRVGVEWGSEGDVFARKLARRLGELGLAPYATPEEALGAVTAGDVDASLIDAVSAYQYIRAHGGEESGLRIVGAPLTQASYAIVVRHTSPLLARAIDQALAELKTESVLQELITKWL